MIADDFGLAPVGRDDDRQRAGRPSQAGELVALATSWYRFGQGPDGEPFAVARAGPGIARMLRGGRASLRAELAASYNRVQGRVPSAQALADCLAVLEGQALASPREPIALRVATGPGPVCYVDLGDPSGRAIRVDRDGWTVADHPPVLFRRSELTGTLPEPAAGDLGPFLDLLNVTADDRSAVLAYLVAVIVGAPVPILFARGPAGAAKSSAARYIVRLLDPSPAPLRAAPRDLEGWAVAAAGSVIVGLDNLTTIPDWFSDALCRAVTGEAIVRRALYTDSGLSVVAFRRAVILTAIDAGALRGDLADRLLTLDLPEIAEGDRRDDGDVESAFLSVWPSALGGLLALAAAVIRTLPEIHLERRPRMADFGRILAAVDKLRGTDGLARYLDQRTDLAREAAEGDLVGAFLITYMVTRDTWTGTAAELLAALTPDRAPRGWPATARGMSGTLRRLVAPLRAAGIAVDFTREPGSRGGRRVIVLTREESGSTVATVATVAPRTNGADPTVAPTVAFAPRPSPTVAPTEHEGAHGDGSDGPSPPLSVAVPIRFGQPLSAPRTCPSCRAAHPVGTTCAVLASEAAS